MVSASLTGERVTTRAAVAGSGLVRLLRVHEGQLLPQSVKRSATPEALRWPAPSAQRSAFDVAYGAPLEGGAWVGLSVTNEGESIPAVDLPYIFERFYRGDRVRTKGEGEKLAPCWLGLAILREAVLAHGWRVEAHSGAGRTCFRVRLPEWR